MKILSLEYKQGQNNIKHTKMCYFLLCASLQIYKKKKKT